ncbi:hypothetical protein CYMTET_36791, partial [Cymbomonas tetramitiformis]
DADMAPPEDSAAWHEEPNGLLVAAGTGFTALSAAQLPPLKEFPSLHTTAMVGWEDAITAQKARVKDVKQSISQIQESSQMKRAVRRAQKMTQRMRKLQRQVAMQRLALRSTLKPGGWAVFMQHVEVLITVVKCEPDGAV